MKTAEELRPWFNQNMIRLAARHRRSEPDGEMPDGTTVFNTWPKFDVDFVVELLEVLEVTQRSLRRVTDWLAERESGGCEHHGTTLSHGPNAPEVISGEFSGDWCGCETYASILDAIEEAQLVLSKTYKPSR